MESLTVAVATDDGKSLIDRHFGDAEYYYIYRLTPDSFELIKKIENTTEEERQHADPVKAKGVTGMLKEENVQVAVSKVFGPNIKRIRKYFVCVTAPGQTMEDALSKLPDHFQELAAQLEAGESRGIVKLERE